MDPVNDFETRKGTAAAPDGDAAPSEANAVSEKESEPAGTDEPEHALVERPVSTTIGTGSFFGIGCSIVALLFVCVGVAIFMWRQVN